MRSPNSISRSEVAIVLLLALGTARSVFAAACCGGTSAAPSLISGDDELQLTASVARSQVIGDAPERGAPVFRSSGHDEITQTYKLDGAMAFAERWQASATLPLVQKSLSTRSIQQSGTQFSDVALGLGFEAWPQWTYSDWIPHGFSFMQVNFPVARSVYDSQAQGQVDAVGSGFYRISLGALLLKDWHAWDASLLPEIHRSFSRGFSDGAGGSLQVTPGWGASLALGGGFSPPRTPIRIGLRLQPIWNEGREIQTDASRSRSSDQWVWDSGIDLSYLVSTEWSLTGSYTDQTLFGPAINTTLSRTLAFSLQRRWPR